MKPTIVKRKAICRTDWLLLPMTLIEVCCASVVAAAEYQVVAPRGGLKVIVSDDGGFNYRVEVAGKTVLTNELTEFRFEGDSRCWFGEESSCTENHYPEGKLSTIPPGKWNTLPLLVLCDSPANYRGQPGVEFFRDLPTVWDETVVLNAEVGKSIVIARRPGERWYLAAMNGEAPASLNVPLNFLGGKKWALYSFADDPKFSDYQKVLESTSGVSTSTVLRLSLAPGGGFAGIINCGDR